ncbi:hypothetical protein [Tepidibacillus marianensis]|uniref:WapI family immunity protein n=1 Tax=Tepidibacillus marianensis TaxID=3131995 RepID=UPI0030CCB93C
MKFTVSGDKAKLGIDVVTRKYPYSDNYWDVNWLTCKVNADIPGYNASFYGEIRTDEMNNFLGELKELDQLVRDMATLHMNEDYVQLEAKKINQGKFNGMYVRLIRPKSGHHYPLNLIQTL